eukprot:scaffold76268_cov75-Phaeocystis_antarctica.AAC.2
MDKAAPANDLPHLSSSSAAFSTPSSGSGHWRIIGKCEEGRPGRLGADQITTGRLRQSQWRRCSSASNYTRERSPYAAGVPTCSGSAADLQWSSGSY